jgi:hypothetical protein
VHQAGDVCVPGALTGQLWRRQLARRQTDETVKGGNGARPAQRRRGQNRARRDALRGTARETGERGASRRTRNLGALPELVTALQAAAPWLELGSHDRLCRTSHDALDAVIAALTARAAALGLTLRPDPELQPQASREGWIALPTVPLTKLT